MSERCPTCDRPRATPEDWDWLGAHECDADPCPDRADVCWAGMDVCDNARVDWRARALAAEAERDAIEHRHRTYADGIAEAIGSDRQVRQSGEPARSDRAEIEALKSERATLRAHVKALLEAERAVSAAEDHEHPPVSYGLASAIDALRDVADAARKVLGE